MSLLYPLVGVEREVPISPGIYAFGSACCVGVRAGVDLLVPCGTRVFAAEAGKLQAQLPFTKDRKTSIRSGGVAIVGASGVLLYGRINPDPSLGQDIERGQYLGYVVPTIRKPEPIPPPADLLPHERKEKKSPPLEFPPPPTMLFVGLWEAGVTLDELRCDFKADARPPKLSDPTELLRAAERPNAVSRRGVVLFAECKEG